MNGSTITGNATGASRMVTGVSTQNQTGTTHGLLVQDTGSVVEIINSLLVSTPGGSILTVSGQVDGAGSFTLANEVYLADDISPPADLATLAGGSFAVGFWFVGSNITGNPDTVVNIAFGEDATNVMYIGASSLTGIASMQVYWTPSVSTNEPMCHSTATLLPGVAYFIVGYYDSVNQVSGILVNNAGLATASLAGKTLVSEASLVAAGVTPGPCRLTLGLNPNVLTNPRPMNAVIGPVFIVNYLPNATQLAAWYNNGAGKPSTAQASHPHYRQLLRRHQLQRRPPRARSCKPSTATRRQRAWPLRPRPRLRQRRHLHRDGGQHGQLCDRDRAV